MPARDFFFFFLATGGCNMDADLVRRLSRVFDGHQSMHRGDVLAALNSGERGRLAAEEPTLAACRSAPLPVAPALTRVAARTSSTRCWNGFSLRTGCSSTPMVRSTPSPDRHALEGRRGGSCASTVWFTEIKSCTCTNIHQHSLTTFTDNIY